MLTRAVPFLKKIEHNRNVQYRWLSVKVQESERVSGGKGLESSI